jgi:UDP-glucose 4-epimerase
MVVVTGGLGFIGNELVRQLIAAGEEVAIVDNRNRVAPHLGDISNVPVHEINITDYKSLVNLFKSKSIDVIYHMAAIHYIPECNEDPERTLRVNVEGTQSVLRAAADAGVKKVVFASSGAVYADAAEALTETSTIAPVDVYGWSKFFGEQLCELNHQLHGTPIVVARLFNNYGPRETNPHIIPEVLNQLRSSNSLNLGKITTIRDYIHTTDCAKALIKLAGQHSGGIETVNVATGYGYSVEQMIELIGEITGRKIEVKHDSQRVRKFDKQVQVANITHLKKLTGWQPEMNIKKGITDLLGFDGVL